MKKIITSAIIMLFFNAAFTQERPLHEIHSMMLYNFTKYIQWPDNGSDKFVIGVLGDDQVYKTLKAWYSNKAKSGKQFSIVKFNSVGDISSCDILYVAKSTSGKFDDIKAKISTQSTLLITDQNGLGKKGSNINFKMVNNRLAFELNKASIEASNLKVSSQLMNIAIVI